jgi:hypothetical protein
MALTIHPFYCKGGYIYISILCVFVTYYRVTFTYTYLPIILFYFISDKLYRSTFLREL